MAAPYNPPLAADGSNVKINDLLLSVSGQALSDVYVGRLQLQAQAGAPWLIADKHAAIRNYIETNIASHPITGAFYTFVLVPGQPLMPTFAFNALVAQAQQQVPPNAPPAPPNAPPMPGAAPQQQQQQQQQPPLPPAPPLNPATTSSEAEPRFPIGLEFANLRVQSTKDSATSLRWVELQQLTPSLQGPNAVQRRPAAYLNRLQQNYGPNIVQRCPVSPYLPGYIPKPALSC
ncbi:hypothetical protein HDU99_005931 [Rhizoclosmatium hyalinum]|nr:hypothetical protein HDU99_005931 [Rhizoclosmatium hyalinum]